MSAKHNGAKNTVLAVLPLRHGRECRIELSRFKGGNYVAMRVWSRGDNGQLKPVGNQGINFPANLVPTVVSCLQQLEQLVKVEQSQGGFDFTKAANDD